MPPLMEDWHGYGNLMSYKIYTRPMARSRCGHFAKTRTEYQSSVQHMLGLLAAHGACTTWDMARLELRNINDVRKKEREYRRFFVGRRDRGRYTGGILDTGLAVREKKTIGRKNSWAYRLSLHGILYCLDAMNLDGNGMDRMASAYAGTLPRIFGMWNELKSALGDNVYCLRVLSQALFLDTPAAGRADGPVHELMSFVHTKYRRNFEVISESDLAEQISYWFYTYLLYHTHPSRSVQARRNAAGRTRRVFERNPEMRAWYRGFFDEARDHCKKRLAAMNSGTPP